MRLPLGVVEAVVAVGSRPLGRPVPLGAQRAWLEAQSRLAVLPTGTRVEAVQVGGRPAERVTGPDPDGGRAVLLLHGGAFTTCSPRTHRVLAAHLAHAAGCAVVVPDYRRAPEAPHPAAVDDADAALAELQEQARTSVAGDSAGGTLALLLALRRRDAGGRLPEALVLLSPVVDLTLRASSGYRGRDVLLRRSWVEAGRDAFVAGADPAALSPLGQDLAGLPRVLVHACEHERLRPEAELLVAALTAAGVDVTHELLPRLWHDAHVHAHLVPEAAEAVARAGGWLRDGGAA